MEEDKIIKLKSEIFDLMVERDKLNTEIQTKLQELNKNKSS
jgi:hypothetical protein